MPFIMPSACVVPFCSTRTGGHKFPRDRILREKWMEAIRRVDFVPSEYSIVCKKHFTKEDYRLPKESMLNNPVAVLKKDSIPSKFPWNDPYFGTPKRRKERKLFLGCSVLQCKSGSSKNNILHSCPNQEWIQKKWADVLKVNKDVVKNMFICSQHFVKTDYIRSKKEESHTLKQNAVPSQKLSTSTRVLSCRKKIIEQKQLLRYKILKKEEKMTEPVSENPKTELDEDVPECRTCLKKMEGKLSVCNIFQSWAPPWVGMEATIAEDLAKLVKIEITESDKCPKVICEPCYQKLLDAALFAAKARYCDQVFKVRLKDDTEKVWPKPIQVDKNINGNVFQEMDIEIKQEVVSDEEFDPVPAEESFAAENSYVDAELENMEIKAEPEDIEEPPPLTITINGTMSLRSSNTENKTLLNGMQDYEAIITEGMQSDLTNGISKEIKEEYLETSIKEEPLSEEEDLEQAPPDLSLDCLLCTKSFNSVTGLKAHVIVHHSYKSVKRKASGSVSPQKKRKDEYRCKICKRSFTTSTDLMVHETCHNKHSCYGCSKNFDTFKQLSKHRKRCQVPPSKTVVKPKTLDDVIRPVKEEKLDPSAVDSTATNHQDSNDSMKLKLDIHSTNTETKAIHTVENTRTTTVTKDCT